MFALNSYRIFMLIQCIIVWRRERKKNTLQQMIQLKCKRFLKTKQEFWFNYTKKQFYRISSENSLFDGFNCSTLTILFMRLVHVMKEILRTKIDLLKICINLKWIDTTLLVKLSLYYIKLEKKKLHPWDIRLLRTKPSPFLPIKTHSRSMRLHEKITVYITDRQRLLLLEIIILNKTSGNLFISIFDVCLCRWWLRQSLA